MRPYWKRKDYDVVDDYEAWLNIYLGEQIRYLLASESAVAQNYSSAFPESGSAPLGALIGKEVVSGPEDSFDDEDLDGLVEALEQALTALESIPAPI